MTYKDFVYEMKEGATLVEYWEIPYKYHLRNYKYTRGNEITIRQDFVFKYMKEERITKLANSQKHVSYIIDYDYQIKNRK